MPNGDELKKLYQVVSDEGLYTKSFDEFQQKYSDSSNIDKLYNVVSGEGLYTKDKNSFYQKYYPNINGNNINQIQQPPLDKILQDYSEKHQVSKNATLGYDVGIAPKGKNGSELITQQDKAQEETLNKAAENTFKKTMGQGAYSKADSATYVNKLKQGVKNGDLAITKDVKGNDVIKNSGNIVESFNEAYRQAFEQKAQDAYLSSLSKDEAIDYLNKKQQHPEAFTQEGSVAPSGIGKFAGEQADLITKGAIGSIGGTALAPETGGASIGTFLATMKDMANSGYSQALAKNYYALKEQGVPDEEAYDRSIHAALTGEAVSLGTSALLSGEVNMGSKLPTPTVSTNGVINSLKHTVKSSPKVVGSAALGDVVNQLESNSVTGKKGINWKEVSESAAPMAAMHFGLGALAAISNGAKAGIPSYARPQIENVVASAPRQEVSNFYQEGEANGAFPQGTTQKVLGTLSRFDQQKAIVAPFRISEESKAAIAGKLVQKQKLLEEKASLKPNENAFPERIKEIDKELSGIDGEINKLYNAKNPFEKETDQITGDKSYQPKTFEELKPQEREGIVVPTEYGKAEVVEKGEGENKTYSPKAYYVEQQGAIGVRKRIPIEGESFTDKDKAQQAADNALKQHYYENGLHDNAKPDKKIQTEETPKEPIQKGDVGSTAVDEQAGKPPIEGGKTEENVGETLQAKKDDIVNQIATQLYPNIGDKSYNKAGRKKVITNPMKEAEDMISYYEKTIIPEQEKTNSSLLENSKKSLDNLKGLVGKYKELEKQTPKQENQSLTDEVSKIPLEKNTIVERTYGGKPTKLLGYIQREATGLKEDMPNYVGDHNWDFAVKLAGGNEDLVKKAVEALPEADRQRVIENIKNKENIPQGLKDALGMKEENISEPIKTETNAITEGEQPEGNIPKHQNGDGGGETAEAGNRNSNEPSGEIKTEPLQEEVNNQGGEPPKGEPPLENKKVGDAARNLAEKIRSGKISKLGGFKTSTGFDAVWDGSLEIVAKTLEGGAAIADAIEEGLKYIRSTDWYKNLKDKKEFETKYAEHLNNEYGGESRTSGGSHRTLSAVAERLGLEKPKRGEVLTPEEYTKRGKQLYDAGVDYEQMAKEFEEDGKVNADMVGVAKARTADLANKADAALKEFGKDSKEFKDAQKEYQDWTENVMKPMGTKFGELGRTLQGETDLDTGSFITVKSAVENETGKPINAAQEKKIQELTEANQKLKTQAEESEAKLISETDKAFNAGVEEGKKQTKSDKAKTIANKLRESAKLHKPNSFSAATPASLVWDAGVEIVAKSIEAGGKLADAIDSGLKYVRESDWYKKLSEDKKQKAESDFKQFHFDNASGNSLEDLQARFVDKRDNKFTVNEAKSIWGYAKQNYLDKGVPYRDMIAQVSNDLGLTWRQVNEAISSPKTKRISDEMWNKQAAYRRGQNVTKTWVESQNKNPAVKALKKISDVFRGVAVFGHGGIFIGTHAAPTLFQPTTWDKVVPAFFRGWKFAYGNNAAYEQKMAELKSRPTYTLAQRAGLKNNPDRLNVEEFQNSQKYLGKLGQAGEKGFNAIKILRQDLFDYHYNRLSAVEKTEPEAIKRLAKLVNNATGATNLDVPKWVNEATFAGGMEAARWGKLITNPIKATGVALKAIYAPDKVSVEDKVFAKVWVSRVGQQVATYASLLAANAAIQNTVNPKNPVNLTNPNAPDFLKFKFGDITIDPTSGMRGAMMFIYGLGKIPFKTQKELKGDTRMQALGKASVGYARGKLSPGYSTMADFFAQQDYDKNPLPFSNDKPSPGHHKLTWGEYAWEKAPLPVAEAARDTYKAALDEGADRVTVNHILDGIVSGAISGATGLRAGEYNAEESNHSPYTEEDKKDPTFKYFLDKGLELPNTSLSSEEITNEKEGTKKHVSDFPKEIQKEYTETHKEELKKELTEIKNKDHVYVKSYKDASGANVSEVYINKPDRKATKKLIDNLSKEELAQVLHIAQSQATKEAKQKIFKSDE